MASAYNLKQRITLAIVPRLASLIIRLLGMTLRYEDVCEPGATPGYDSPPPAVYAFWHRCLLAGAWRFRKYGLTILISRSFDGELIARTVERLGYVAIRGSSSRDGAPGLRNMQRAYLSGHYCAFTADGPRGPAMVAKPGAAQLAATRQHYRPHLLHPSPPGVAAAILGPLPHPQTFFAGGDRLDTSRACRPALGPGRPRPLCRTGPIDEKIVEKSERFQAAKNHHAKHHKVTTIYHPKHHKLPRIFDLICAYPNSISTFPKS